MPKGKSIIATIATTIVTGIIVISLIGPAGAAGSVSQVQVVNTPLPVDITDGSLPATQSGAWNVGISGVARMQHAPTAPANSSVSAFFGGSSVSTGGSTAEGTLFTVPAGQRAIVQTLSFRVQVPSGQSTYCYAYTSSSAEITVPVAPRATISTSQVYTGTQEASLYVGPGETLKAFCTKSSASGSGFVRATVVHYSVPA